MGSVNTSDYTIILCIIIHKSTINKLVFKQFMWIVDIKHNPLNLYKLPLTIKKFKKSTTITPVSYTHLTLPTKRIV